MTQKLLYQLVVFGRMLVEGCDAWVGKGSPTRRMRWKKNKQHFYHVGKTKQLNK